MSIKNIVGLLAMVLIYSCSQRSSENVHVVVDDHASGRMQENQLKIENGINRGIKYNDILGLTYIPITLTNNSLVPLDIQINFSADYIHPHPESDESFKIIPMPKEWTESKPVTDRMINELKNFINNPSVNRILVPKEKFTIAIGTLRPAPSKVCGIIPKVLFETTNKEEAAEYEWMTEKGQISNNEIELGLKLDYCINTDNAPSGHILVHCGKVSYAEE